MKRYRGVLGSAGLLAALVAVAFFAPFLTRILGIDPYAMDVGAIYAPPSARHYLGTDDLGRDVLARLLHGGRVSLTVGLVAAVVSAALGAGLGLVAGYFGGVVDAAIMRVTEGAMALPKLLVMMLLAAVDLEKVLPGVELTRGDAASIVKLIIIIVLFGWMTALRLARASALQLRELDFVRAARVLGASDLRILSTHILPNAAAPIVVAATLDVGEIIVYESVLSFLGLGVAPPTPSWGAMLANGMTYLHTAPLLAILPGLLTFLTVAAVTALGDRLRDALDPRSVAVRIPAATDRR